MTTAIPFDLEQAFRRIGGQPATGRDGGARSADSQLESDFPEPEDRGLATLSALGDIEYVEDLIRPGRIHLWAAEEGSGKSFAVDDELGIRVATAGGSFAGTWPVRRTGPVLYLSEMHPDDDFERERLTLDSLALERMALKDRFYRQSLMTAAGGRPALTDEAWRSSITDWLRYRGAVMLIIDTATGATQVDPWGKEIQSVYAGLRRMLESYPALAIVLVVHLKKPSGRGARRLSDVLGEWGRWADIVVLQENDGTSFERSRITVRKRVRRERRIVATKRGGLLVDPVEAAAGSARKATSEQVLAAVVAAPGSSYAALAGVLGVSKDSATRYVKELGGVVELHNDGPRGTVRVYPTAAPPHTAAPAPAAGQGQADGDDHRSAARTYISAVPHAVDSGTAMAAAHSGSNAREQSDSLGLVD